MPDNNEYTPRRQSSIGTRYIRRHKEGSNIDRISFARVTKINYRYNTVDVVSLGGDYTLSSKGRASAKLPIQFGGTTTDGKSFGQINPVEVGTYVLIGFINGEKTTPVVLAMYNGEEEAHKLSRTPFEESDSRDEELKELSKQKFTVYPSLTYDNVDGKGNRTVSFTGKSFITTEAGANPEVGGLTDNEDGTRYDELNSSYYYTGELIEPKENRAPVILFKHQGDKFAKNEEGVETDKHSFMWFLDDDGTHRTSIMNEDEDWRTYFEMTPEGKIQLVRQNDTKEIGTSNNKFSIGVEEDGIRFQVGDRYQLITPDGTFGNLGMGGGSSGGGGIPDDVLDEINKKLDLADRKILEMGTYMEQTDAFITMGADLLEEIEDGMVQYESNFTILAEEIRSSVSETKLRDLLNEELNTLIGDIEEITAEAQEQLEIITGFVSDGKLTPDEKEILAPGYQSIKTEYPTYLEQAKDNEKDTRSYTKAYEELIELMGPIMAKPDETSSVDPIDFKAKYENYYNTRQQLLTGILYRLQEDIMEVAKETSKVAKDATKALVDAGAAISDAEQALGSLKNMADSNEATPVEKNNLKREINQIMAEYEEYVTQAEDFEVDSIGYTNAYESLTNFVGSSKVFEDMTVTTTINGQTLYDLVEAYYKERIKITTEIAKKSSEQLKELHANFEQHQTKIEETSKEISLVADSVVATEESINVAMAKLSIMSDRIQSTVSSATFKREIDENRNTLNATGRNMHVNSTATKGVVIKPENGKTETSPGGSASAYIKVSGGTDYTGSVHNNTGTNTLTVAYYTANQDHVASESKAISSGDKYVEMEAPAPPKARYARVSVDNASVSDVQFERGTASKFYMYSNEDLLNSLEAATEEKLNREIAWKDKNTRRIEKSEESVGILAELDNILETLEISKADAERLTEEIRKLEKTHGDLLEEAEELGIQTINIEMALSTLQTAETLYLTPAIENDGKTLEPAEQEQLESRFKDYLDRRSGYYKQVDEKFEASYEASVEVLDEVLAGSLEAERIAREAAIAAEKAAQDVMALEEQSAEANQMEARHLNKIREIVADDVLTPIEKEYGITMMNEIKDEIEWLITQGRSIGLSTNDLENAFNRLEAYHAAFVTPEKLLKESKVNGQTYEDNFQDYHTAKITFIANLLGEARKDHKSKDEEAKLARDETLRRDEDLQRIHNIIDDSEIAIERIEKKVESLENTHAYSIEILSTNGFTFKDRIIETTLKVTVRQGTKDVTDEIKQENFVWTKTLANGETDTDWGKIHEGIGPEVELTHEDIKGKATFIVEVYIEEEV